MNFHHFEKTLHRNDILVLVFFTKTANEPSTIFARINIFPDNSKTTNYKLEKIQHFLDIFTELKFADI